MARKVATNGLASTEQSNSENS